MIPESGTVSRSGDGEGKKKYAFDESDVLSTVARKAALWGMLGMTDAWRTFMELAGASISN